LYEYEFRSKAGDASADIDSIVAKNIEPYAKALGDVDFVHDLTHGVFDEMEQLDKELQPMAPEWPISSISAIDRNVLRMGLYELSECRDSIPPKVAINEAVELAKAFGSENSSKFINGVLGTAYKQLGIVEEKHDEPRNPAAEEAKTDDNEQSGTTES
jgi:N utilization substance protein B